MNMLLYTENDLEQSGFLRLTGDRAAHLLNKRGLDTGDILRVGKLRGEIGTAKVLEIGNQSILLEIDQLVASSASPAVDLVLALPRPQILKRVLQTVATMGVERLLLIRASRGEKSYFQSKLLSETKIAYHLGLGLEQGIATTPPEVSVRTAFKEFIAEDLEQIAINCDLCVLAHTSASCGLGELGFSKESKGGVKAGSKGIETNSRVALAVGPEAGWDNKEVDIFKKHGFHCISLGERVLRVDTAVTALLSQIALLRQLNARS